MYFIQVDGGVTEEQTTKEQVETRIAELINVDEYHESDIMVIKGKEITFTTTLKSVTVEIDE